MFHNETFIQFIISYRNLQSLINSINYNIPWRDIMNIGEIIAELRMDKNMNQEDLAAVLNISRSALANWESGNRRIDIETLVVIADYFEVSCDYLLGRTKHKYNFALENKKNVDAIMDVYETLKKYKIEKY